MHEEFVRDGDGVSARTHVAQHKQTPNGRFPAARGTTPTLPETSSAAANEAIVSPVIAYLDSKSLAALSLAPLVAIAWAEGGVGDMERGRVLSWAAEMGLSTEDHAYQLLEQWMAEPPSAGLLTIWKRDYVNGLSLTLSREARRALKVEILSRAKALVELTGSFSGVGQMPSRAEQGVMEEIDRALS